MKITRSGKSFVLGVVVLSAMMLVSLLAIAPAPEASALSGPCPSYSIQNVFDDPNGNWDNDQMRNADELYNGLNPCVVDTDAFCAGGGNALCIYFTYVYTDHYYPTACQTSINAFPSADYDGDGISNAVEVRNGANPCAHPCPNPTRADLALNPNGSWDSDGISNAIEVSQGTNPCSAYSVAQPAVTTYVRIAPVQRLPHVTIAQQPVYTPPRVVYNVPVTPVCPRSYPYFHRDNGLCYANPVGNRWY